MNKINFKRILLLPAIALAFVFAFMQFKQASAEETLTETWGPQDRASFTWDSPADYVTFNSMTNNPTIGSEHNFVRVKEWDGTSGHHVDEVTVEPGKEYEVYAYYHNNAYADLNESGRGMAQNVMLKSNFPTKLTSGDVGVIKGTIFSSNANPKEVWDTAFLRANSTVYLSYVPGTAIIHNGGTANGKNIDPEAMFNDGALLAYDDRYWGMIPGCNEFAGYVTYRIRVDAPDFWVEKNAAKNGSTDYADTITVAPGDTIDFQIKYQNTGTTRQTAVTAHDTMPDGLDYVGGSTVVTSPEAVNGVIVADRLFSEAGLVIGDFNGGEQATIKYSAKVSDKFPCGESVIYNDAYVVTANGTEYDKVKVSVVRTCTTTPTELPTTGPGEIVMAVGVVLVIGGGAFYFYRSHKMLKKATAVSNGATGTDISASDINADDLFKKDDVKPESSSTEVKAQEQTTAPEKAATDSESGNHDDIVKDSIL